MDGNLPYLEDRIATYIIFIDTGSFPEVFGTKVSEDVALIARSLEYATVRYGDVMGDI